jgi:prephenate dehydratase
MGGDIGYLGPPGTFGEQAALCCDSGATLIPFPSNGAVVAAVEAGEVERGVAPIENIVEGAVNDTLDALLQAENVKIMGELVIPIEQCLVAARGARLEDVRIVMSHPQALAQCRAFLETRLPAARLEAALSTSAAVEAAVRTKDVAAIGTPGRRISGGDILAAGIQDVRNNKTRFLVLSRRDAARSGDDRRRWRSPWRTTSPHVSRRFERVRGRRINLTRIESRPSRRN